MKTMFLLLSAVVLTGCGAMQPLPPGSVPFYLPPPMQAYQIPVQRAVNTTCYNTGNGRFQCVTR